MSNSGLILKVCKPWPISGYHTLVQDSNTGQYLTTNKTEHAVQSYVARQGYLCYNPTNAEKIET